MAGWNGSGSAGGSSAPQAPKKKSGASSPVWQKGALAGLVVVAIGAAVLYMMRPAEKPVEKVAKKQTAITEVKPAAAPTNKVEVSVVDGELARRKKARAALDAKIYTDEQGVRRYPGGLRVHDENAETLNIPQPRRIFKHYAEEEIATLLTLEPGAVLIGDIPYDARFLADFKKSLKEPIEFSPDDTDGERALKEAVQETKEDLRKRMAAGEDVCDIMQQTREQLKENMRYYDTMQIELSKIQKDPNYSVNDVEDFITAANEMLKSKGIESKGFRLSKLVRRRLELQREQAATTSAPSETSDK